MPHTRIRFQCGWYKLLPQDVLNVPNDPLWPLPSMESIPNCIHEAFRLRDSSPQAACLIAKPAFRLIFDPAELDFILGEFCTIPTPQAPEHWEITGIRFPDGPNYPEIAFTAEFLLQLNAFVPTPTELAILERQHRSSFADGLTLSFHAQGSFTMFTKDKATTQICV